MTYGEEQFICDFDEVCRVLRQREFTNYRETTIIKGNNMMNGSEPAIALIRKHNGFIHEEFIEDTSNETIKLNTISRKFFEHLSLQDTNNKNEKTLIGSICFRQIDGSKIEAPSIRIESLTSELRKKFILAAHSILTPEEVDQKLAQRLATNIQNRQLRKEQIASFSNTLK